MDPMEVKRLDRCKWRVSTQVVVLSSEYLLYRPQAGSHLGWTHRALYDYDYEGPATEHLFLVGMRLLIVVGILGWDPGWDTPTPLYNIRTRAGFIQTRAGTFWKRQVWIE